MRIVHAVVTEAFAGTERYVVDVATEQAARGADVFVIAGEPVRSRLGPEVIWLPGGRVPQALRSARALRQVDVAHAHLTYGELALRASAGRHGGRLVATRHLATPRGQSTAGRLLRPYIERGLGREIAISDYVSQALSGGRLPVLRNGVADTERVRPETSRTVVIAQRLEAEKATAVGIKAFLASSLPRQGWQLWVAGEGSEGALLEQRYAATSVTFLGHVRDMRALYAEAAVLLAPAPGEPLGLTVIEAMACGLPVVAADAGGHRESLHARRDLLFPPGDASAAAAALDALREDTVRAEVGRVLQTVQRDEFSLRRHVAALEGLYLA